MVTHLSEEFQTTMNYNDECVLELQFKRSPFGNILYPFSHVSPRVYLSMTAPAMEHRLIVVDRNGSGRVLHYLLNNSSHRINSKCHVEEWTSLKGLSDFACVVHANRLYVIGGVLAKSRETLADCLCYNPESNQWSALPPLNNPRSHCTAVSIKEGVLVAGGFKATDKLTNSSELFLPISSSWRQVGSLPQCRADASACSSGGVALCSGGTRQSTPNSPISNTDSEVLVGSSTIWQFQTHKMIWEELDPDCPQNLSKPVTKTTSISVNNKIYFIGGLKSVIHENKLKQMTISLMESFQFGQSVRSDIHKPTAKQSTKDKANVLPKSWMTPWRRSLQSPKINRYDAAVINSGCYIYLIGGSTTDIVPNQKFNKGVKEIEVFDTVGETWSPLHRLPQNFDARKVSAFILKYPVLKRKATGLSGFPNNCGGHDGKHSHDSDPDTSSSIYYRMNFIPP